MITLARIVLEPSTLAAWLVLGAACGWLAGKFMEEATYGIVGDLFLGALGAFIGGCVYGLLVEGVPGFWGALLLALVGACVLIGGARVIAAARRAD